MKNPDNICTHYHHSFLTIPTTINYSISVLRKLEVITHGGVIKQTLFCSKATRTPIILLKYVQGQTYER